MQQLLEGNVKVKRRTQDAQRNKIAKPETLASSFAATMEVEDEDDASKRSEEEEDYGDDQVMEEDEVNIPGQLVKKSNNNLLIYTTNGVGLVVSGAFVEVY